jgi:transposase InsO family protein
VPADPSLFTQILRELHDAAYAGHPGHGRTLASVAKLFWWPRMAATVRRYVSSCATCQQTKPSAQATPGLLQPHATPSRPWTHVSLDLITDLPESPALDGGSYDSVLTVVDMFSKQAHFVPTRKTVTSQQLAALFLQNVYRLHGLPTMLVSDRDPRFTADFWQTVWRHLGTKLNLSSAYHPQTDGQTERTHRTLEQLLRAYVHPEHDNWASRLPVLEAAYNSAVHATTKQSPFYVNYGFEPLTPASLHLPQAVPSSFDSDARALLDSMRDIHQLVASELDLAKARAAEYANRSRRELTFAVGDKVRLSTQHVVLGAQPSRKLRDRYAGPFTVTEVITPVSYRLQLPESLSRLHPVFHVSRLLPWTDDTPAEFPGREQQPRPTLAARDYIQDEEAYEVERLLDVKIEKDMHTTGHPLCLKFLVRWAAPFNDPSEDRWEPLKNVHRLDALAEFVCTPKWLAFKTTAAYKAFAKKYPKRLPRRVTLAV